MVFATGTSMLCLALPLLPPLLFESGGEVAEDEAMLSLLDRITRTSQVMSGVAAAVTAHALAATGTHFIAIVCACALTPAAGNERHKHRGGG